MSRSSKYDHDVTIIVCCFALAALLSIVSLVLPAVLGGSFGAAGR